MKKIATAGIALTAMMAAGTIDWREEGTSPAGARIEVVQDFVMVAQGTTRDGCTFYRAENKGRMEQDRLWWQMGDGNFTSNRNDADCTTSG